MKHNAFRGATATLRNGDPIAALKFGKSQSSALDERTGEFNAYDKKDLMQSISKLMAACASGEVVQQQQLMTKEEIKEQHRMAIASAVADASGEQWAALGAALALRIEETRDRAGFMRKTLLGDTLKTGDYARVTVPMWDATAVVATSSSNVGYQIVRNKNMFLSEFEITANVRVEELDLEQNGADLLDNAYRQGLDAIMVKEDLLLKQAADKSVGLVNKVNYISGQLSPQILSVARSQVTDWNLPVSSALLSNDLWNDVIGNNDFASFLDPVTKYDLAMNGYLGTLLNMDLGTDGFRQPNQKVLNRGELYVFANPENLGCYTDRGGVRSTPTSGADSGNSTRGWNMREFITMVLANPRGVSKVVKRG